MQIKHFFICSLLLLFGTAGFSQVNFLGKPGYMATPSATWGEQPLGLSFAYLPKEYSVFTTPGINTVNFYNTRLSLTSFMEVNFTVAYRPLMAEKAGIGDRQMDFRFKLLKETKYLPTIVLGLSVPGSVAPVLGHDYIVITKHFSALFGELSFSGGYGSPYIIRKNPNIDDFFKAIEIRTKKDYAQGEYLTGFFGGFSFEPTKYGGIMLEYDTQTFNAGAYLKPLPWLLLQGYTFEGKEWAFSFAGSIPLNFAPRALRRYEKDLD